MGDLKKGDRVAINVEFIRTWEKNGYGSVFVPIHPRGVVSLIQRTLALIKLDEPRQVMECGPVDSQSVDETMYEPSTAAIGSGLAHALEDANDLPSGRWSKNPKIYLLDDPVDVSVFKDFCRKFGDERCWVQSLMLTTVPIAGSNFTSIYKI